MAGSSTKKDQKNSRKVAHREQRKKQQQREKNIIIAVVAVLALIIAAALIIPNLPGNSENVQKAEALIRNQVDGAYAGDPNAPVKVVEFSDFNCSHCYEFFSTQEPELVNDYINTGKVYFQYVPMSFISASSTTAAEATYCAMDQGKFWEYHDTLFANYGTEFTNSILSAIAAEVGLDQTEFDDCYTGNKYTVQVQNDNAFAQEQGVTGTPTFSVNGQLTDRTSLLSVIDSELAK